MARIGALVLFVGVLWVPGFVLGQVLGLQDHGGDNVPTWLPRALVPEHYRVRIQPILEEGNFTAPAHLEFTFRARQPASKVVVHVRDLKINESSVTVEEEVIPHGWVSLPVVGHEFDGELETYAAALATPLSPGHRYRLGVQYEAPVSDTMKGLYRVSYMDSNNNKRWIAMTQLHPTNARTMFPCMDEPQYKARFTLSVARRGQYVSVANMPAVKSEPMADGDWVWDHFETSVPMSTYLVAIAVLDFGKLESTTRQSSTSASSASAGKDVLFRVWARPSELLRGAYASRIGPRVLRYYADTFNISFPLPKQDMLATPKLFYGAMENWGLITFREGGLLVDEADTGSQHYVATIVAHELAHQWFGNLVTNLWWNDVWLNEGFATYMSQLGVKHVEPQWRSEGVFVLENMQGVMQKDALPSSHPVSREVYRVSDIDHLFDQISYQKGSSVVRMMSEFLGADTFQRGLNAYLRRHAYANAAQDDLWAALTDAAEDRVLPPGRSVKDIMDSWTLRTGFPVVSVNRDYLRGTANVTQRRFRVSTSTNTRTNFDPETENCCWGVPLWLKTLHSEAFHWLAGRELLLRGLPGPEDWVLVNGQRAGFYRINYDYSNWRLLTLSLADGALGDMESAGLVDDALALAGAGQLGYDVALGLLRHLPRQQPSLAWVAALPWLSKMSHLLHGTAGSPNPFERWSRGVAADLLLVSDGLHRSTDPVDHAFVSRVRRWACGLGVPGCLGTVTVAAAARTYIELGLNDTDVCGASQSDEEWDTLLSKLIKEDSTLYLKLAECIQSPVVVKKMMELAVEHNYDAADSLVKNLSANPYTFDTLIQYLKNNWMLLHERFGPNFSYDILKATAPYAKNNDHMVEIKKMMSALKKSNPPQSLQEDGSHNIWWLQNQAEKLLHKLQDL